MSYKTNISEKEVDEALLELIRMSRDICGYKDVCELHLDMWRQELEYHRSCWFAPRGWLKTTARTIAYALYRIAKNRNIRILIVNEVYGNAVNMLKEIKNHLRSNEKFKKAYGDFYTGNTKWQEEQIQVKRNKDLPNYFAKEPTVMLGSSNGAIVSSHADLIIVDDPISDQNSWTAHGREKIERWLRQSLFPIAEESETEGPGEIHFHMTRWHPDDFGAKILEDEDFKDWAVNDEKSRRALNEEGHSTFPRKFSDTALARKKSDLGAIYWAAQMENDPTMMKDNILKGEWLQYYGEEHPLPKREDLSVYMGVDCSINPGTKPDKFVIVTIGIEKILRNIYLLNVLSMHCDFPTQLTIIKREWEHQNPLAIGIESNHYQIAIPQMLKYMPETRHIADSIQEIHSTQNKIMRLTGLSIPFSNGAVYIHPRMVGFKKEYIHFPMFRTDDILDAFDLALKTEKKAKKATGFASWTRGTDEQIDAYRKKKEMERKAYLEKQKSDPNHKRIPYGKQRMMGLIK